MPKFIAELLESDWLWHLSRIIITFMFWYAGFGFLFDFTGAQATMGMTGLQPLWLIAALTILVEIGASLLIVVDRFVWFAAGALGVFTLLTIPLVHHFWTMQGGEAISAKLESEEHLTVVGGLIILSIASHIRKQWKAGIASRGTQN
jgi:transmembrane protein